MIQEKVIKIENFIYSINNIGFNYTYTNKFGTISFFVKRGNIRSDILTFDIINITFSEFTEMIINECTKIILNSRDSFNLILMKQKELF